MTSYRGQCHCGAVSFTFPNTPDFLTQCNCSLCRRLGALWAYETRQNVVLDYDADATIIYVQGDETLEAHSCKICGCTTHWLSVGGDETSRMAVNFRLCDPNHIETIRVRQFDGADTWEFLDQEAQMLDIQSVNHIGIRVSDKQAAIDFYVLLGFDLVSDVGFENGHPVIMRHSSGVVINLLGPANVTDGVNILQDVEQKHPGITHVALTVSSIDHAREFADSNDIGITGSFSFGNMSAIFIRDPDRNVIELDAYDDAECDEEGYEHHP